MEKKTCEHNYASMDRSYYKETGSTTDTGLPKYDHSISYKMLFCSKCGDTMEVISKDHRQEKEEDKPST